SAARDAPGDGHRRPRRATRIEHDAGRRHPGARSHTPELAGGPDRRRHPARRGGHSWLHRLEAYGHESPGADAPDVERGRAMGERTPGLETNSAASPRAVVEELGSEVPGVPRGLDTL